MMGQGRSRGITGLRGEGAPPLPYEGGRQGRDRGREACRLDHGMLQGPHLVAPFFSVT